MMQQPETDLSAPTNGAGMGMAMPTMYTREQIVEMVGQHERDTEPLRSRMDVDYEWYRLNDHINKDPHNEVLADYAVYTSNESRTFADKVISWITDAELLIRAPHIDVGDHEEEADNLKERFAIGNLEASDDRLLRLLQPVLRAQAAFFTCVRGGYVGGRSLLAKHPLTGETYADIMPWDPMHIHWSVGADGLDWVCYKIKKTATQIKKEYGVDISGEMGVDSGVEQGSSDAEKEGIEVYDFYDGMINWIFTDKTDLKVPTPHGSPSVPVYLVLVGNQPLLQSDNTSNLIADVGESVYAAVRKVYDRFNNIMSIMMEIVERARRQTVVAESQGGKKTLPEDPFIHPTTISTVTGEKIYTLELQQMAQETMAYIGMISGEIQRGTLPHSVYGELQFQLSGFAINTLRQGIETVLSSRVHAVAQMYKQIVNLLYSQFMTGAFDAITLSGMAAGRKYFKNTLTPDQLIGTCDYTVELVSQLPQDDMTKWAIAQIASEGKLLAKVDILDTIVGIQDSQQAIDKVKHEMAEQGLPEAVMYDLGSAAAERGDMVTAQLYLMEYMRIMAVKMGVMPPAPGDGGGGQGTPAKGGGQRPEVMPRAAAGASPPSETSNAGPGMVPPGTPRPGAQGQSS